MTLSDSHEIVSRFGDSIDDFRRVFRKNDVDFGAPDDFFAFARTIRHNTQLRANLSILARSIMVKEHQVSLRTILTIIAVASGGEEVANSVRDMTRPVNLIVDFLIEAGGCSRINVEHPDSPCSETVGNSADQALTLNQSSFSASRQTEQTDLPTSANSREETFSDSGVNQFVPDDNGATQALTDSLTRLELNALQVKLYLDSIDQRISRMEPRLENVPVHLFSDQTSSTREDAAEAKYSTEIPFEAAPLPAQPSPVQDDPPPIPASFQPSNETAEAPNPPSHRWIASHRKSFSPRGPIGLSLILCLAVILLGALLYRGLSRDAAKAGVHLGAPMADDTLRPRSADATPGVESHSDFLSANINAPSRIPAASAGTRLEQTPDPTTDKSAQTAQISSSPASSPRSSASNAPIPAYPKTANALSPASAPAPSGIANPAAAPTSLRTSSPRLVSVPSRVNVSSGVMAANLLDARMPPYPKLASLTRTQGNVVMQAIISKKGTVESLHVITGHRLLRGAATNAARTWRYRPYLVNGRPVEVATIVSVDFTLNH